MSAKNVETLKEAMAALDSEGVEGLLRYLLVGADARGGGVRVGGCEAAQSA
jgi:hypothetical protein